MMDFSLVILFLRFYFLLKLIKVIQKQWSTIKKYKIWNILTSSTWSQWTTNERHNTGFACQSNQECVCWEWGKGVQSHSSNLPFCLKIQISELDLVMADRCSVLASDWLSNSWTQRGSPPPPPPHRPQTASYSLTQTVSLWMFERLKSLVPLTSNSKLNSDVHFYRPAARLRRPARPVSLGVGEVRCSWFMSSVSGGSGLSFVEGGK